MSRRDLGEKEEKAGKAGPLWAGRLEGKLDPLVGSYARSLEWDRRLAFYDLQGSRAHASMLAEQGILSPEDRDRILQGLDQIEEELRSGSFPFREELEDIHMNIEQRLQELVGEAGSRLHTGRSRNDQVALDLKLYCHDLAGRWQRSLLEVQKTLLHRAQDLKTELFPGWTHLQAAQPLSWAHYLLAFAEMLRRDFLRLQDWRKRHSLSPLGAGALAGSTLPLDPERTARSLGFSGSFLNSYDVAGDRDFILELLQAASQVMLHLSRLAEDFVYLSSTPVGWIELPDRLCTGSSMMPQKKNPDILELMRGKTASVLGHTHALAVLLKGLPTSYHRDLQQDKEHLFAVSDTVSASLELLPVLLSGFQVRSQRVEKALQEGFLMATDLAEYLVRRGVPFREAHRQVGSLVAHCVRENCFLHELSLKTLRRHAPACQEDVLAVLQPSSVLQSRRHRGATGVVPVEEQITFWKGWIDREEQALSDSRGAHGGRGQ